MLAVGTAATMDTVADLSGDTYGTGLGSVAACF
jgi:hypothetical protein